MSSIRPKYAQDFEALTGYRVVRTEVDSDGEETYVVEYEVGGTDEDGIYQLVLGGPAQGERVYVRYF